MSNATASETVSPVLTSLQEDLDAREKTKLILRGLESWKNALNENHIVRIKNRKPLEPGKDVYVLPENIVAGTDNHCMDMNILSDQTPQEASEVEVTADSEDDGEASPDAPVDVDDKAKGPDEKPASALATRLSDAEDPANSNTASDEHSTTDDEPQSSPAGSRKFRTAILVAALMAGSQILQLI